MTQQQRDLQVITTVADMQRYAGQERIAGKRVGCVPTMGALHDGHASLIRAAATECDTVVTSIFVNPTQFGPNEDFDRYPRTLEADIELVREAGGTIVFAPGVPEMYPAGNATVVQVAGVTEVLEGNRRPGHFDGVATVVTKLFQAMLPHVAYFGQKDYQQTLVVRALVRDLLIPVEISVVPTRREDDGLAMSSRNRYLSADDRIRATVIHRALAAGRDAALGGDRGIQHLEATMRAVLDTVPELNIEYATAAHAGTLQPYEQQADPIVLLIAARLGNTRLIDNMLLDTP